MTEPGPSASALGEMLRAHRARLQPADVGLPDTDRRRARGLRREEVALLAHLSTTYYTYLEQGRTVRPSRQVIDALALALRLSDPEHALLIQLAGGPRPAAAVEVLAPGMADLVDRLDPDPTYVTGRRWDILASNAAARELFTDWPAQPLPQRNILWFMFCDPAARTLYLDWEREAAAQLGRFRAAVAQRGDNVEVTAFLAELCDHSDEVRQWWATAEPLPLSSGQKRLRHPRLGEVTLHHLVLQVADHPDQKIVTFSGLNAGSRPGPPRS